MEQLGEITGIPIYKTNDPNAQFMVLTEYSLQGMSVFFEQKKKIEPNKTPPSKRMDYREASEIIEDVLDALVEVGNGVSDSDLHDVADKLFKFRDNYLNIAPTRYLQR